MKKAKVILDRNNKRGGTELRDESQWVQEVLQGNKEAFAFIIDRYKQRIYAFIYRICRNKHDAQDWTQEVFIRAYRYLQSYRQDKPFSAWIYKIAVNTCNTQLQKRKPTRGKRLKKFRQQIRRTVPKRWWSVAKEKRIATSFRPTAGTLSYGDHAPVYG